MGEPTADLQVRRARTVEEQIDSIVQGCGCPACTGADTSEHCIDCDCSVCEPLDDFCIPCLGPCTDLCWGDDL